MRNDQRRSEEIRKVRLNPEVLSYAEGSVEVSFGNTRVLCSASLEPNVPKWLAGTGKGWITAEYGMLPRSTHTRINREKAASSGRSQEISRLIGRSLRAAVDLKRIGERQLVVDCDVLQADGGTRTAAITGGFTALALALKFLRDRGDLQDIPLSRYVSAISVGMTPQGPIIDLNYEEDVACSTDMNFVITSEGEFVEIQGTAEGLPFSKADMDRMADLALRGCRELHRAQSEIIGGFFPLKTTGF